MLDRSIGIGGIALALLFGFWSIKPDLFPKVPNWIVVLGMAISFLLIGLAIGLVVADKRNSGEEYVETAELQLHTYGDDRMPIRMSLENIWRWYSLRNIMVAIDPSSGKRAEYEVINLFVTFDRPVKIGTLEVGSPDMKLPQYEVKDFSNRSAVIGFMGSLAAGTLVVRVRP